MLAGHSTEPKFLLTTGQRMRTSAEPNSATASSLSHLFQAAAGQMIKSEIQRSVLNVLSGVSGREV
jgi:hypothetical protein